MATLSHQLEQLDDDIEQAKSRDDVSEVTRLEQEKLDLENKLRDAQLTLYRLDPDKAIDQLDELMKDDDEHIRGAAQSFARALVGDDREKQDLLADLWQVDGARALLKAQAYGI